MSKIIDFENVEKTYNAGAANEITAATSINTNIEEGEFVSLIGPTGCGKSTLIEMVAGLIQPSSGSIRYRGDLITSPDPSIGIVFQEDSTFPWRTVLENVTFGLEASNVDKKERKRVAEEMIELVGLSGFEEKYPNQLSGGMRQRVSIARTLVTKPDVLLMDEPFGALDEQTRLILGNELLDIWRETGSTVIFVTHSISEAIQLSDRVLVMTSRPGSIKDEVEIDIDRPREDIMDTERYGQLNSILWKSLKEESKKGMQQAAVAGDD